MENRLPSSEPGPEPDTTDAAEPDDTDADLDSEDAPTMMERGDEHVDAMDV